MLCILSDNIFPKEMIMKQVKTVKELIEREYVKKNKSDTCMSEIYF
jgi:hypothetical protein